MDKKDAISLAMENAANDPKLRALRQEGQKLVLCAIYDKKAEVYTNLNTTPSCAYAIRGFIEACKDEKSMLNQFSKDFRLDYLGTFDTATGLVKQGEVPEILIEAANVVVK